MVVHVAMSDDWKPRRRGLDGVHRRAWSACCRPRAAAPDWKANAYRWRKSPRGGGYLEAGAPSAHGSASRTLKDIDEQKRRLRDKHAQFVAGPPRQQRAPHRCAAAPARARS